MYNVKLLEVRMKICGFNRYSLAREAKVDRSTVEKLMETGNIHPDKAFKIAVALGIKIKRSDLTPILDMSKLEQNA